MQQLPAPPLSLDDNLRWRTALRLWAAKNKAAQRLIVERCSRDFLFWLSGFCYVFEPRAADKNKTILPFLPWPRQLGMLESFDECFGRQDIGCLKSRGEGVSWFVLMYMLHQWLFYPMRTFGLVSRNELAVDNPEDPDSLMWKLDWQLSKLPPWMAPSFTRNLSKHTLRNNGNGSTFTGYACTGDLASGGRKTAFLMDELSKFPRPGDEESLSATEPVTECRVIVATPNGTGNAYHRVMHESSSLKKVVLHWADNPSRNSGLFRLIKGVPVEEDGSNPLPKGYADKFLKEYRNILEVRGFDILDEKKQWSPWYVKRCLRPRMTPKKVAAEYDLDFGGSGSRVFMVSMIDRLKERARPPVVRGELIFDRDTLKPEEFITDKESGRLKLWIPLTARGTPPPGEYAIGADIASGQGGDMSSNSVLSIADMMTGKKVGEYASPTIRPDKLAELAVGLCKWFCGLKGEPAYLIWEGNGYGGTFRDRIYESDFRHFYRRKSLKAVNGRRTKEGGWWSGRDSKRDLIDSYRWSLQEGLFDNPSELALDECLCYVNDERGGVTFQGDLADERDPANSGENHGDRVIADALVCHAIQDRGKRAAKESEASPIDPPPNSFLGRRNEYLKLKARKDLW